MGALGSGCAIRPGAQAGALSSHRRGCRPGDGVLGQGRGWWAVPGGGAAGGGGPRGPPVGCLLFLAPVPCLSFRWPPSGHRPGATAKTTFPTSRPVPRRPSMWSRPSRRSPGTRSSRWVSAAIGACGDGAPAWPPPPAPLPAGPLQPGAVAGLGERPIPSSESAPRAPRPLGRACPAWHAPPVRSYPKRFS